MTLQVLAEGFSAAGCRCSPPTSRATSPDRRHGQAQEGLARRAKEIGLDDWSNAKCPTVLWDLFGEEGHPIRATVQEMGPLLLSRLIELNETQEGVLNIMFRVAADERKAGKDMHAARPQRSALHGQRGRGARQTLTTKYGNVSAVSVGAIQRRLLVLEEQGANSFFGEPALDIADFMRTAPDGRGVVNILAANSLMNTPRLYGTFLL